MMETEQFSQLACQWLAPDAFSQLKEGEVSIWKFDPLEFNSLMEHFIPLLTSYERQRLDRFVDLRARQEFAVCRGVLHLLLAVLSGQPPGSLRISDDRGKPRMLEKDTHSHPIAFNLSHTEGLCLIACSLQLEVGVDVEKVQPLPELEAMAKKYLSPHEMIAWRRLKPEQQAEGFYRFWCAKEALLKALGSGLRISPAQIDVLDVLDGKKVSGKQEDGFFFEVDHCVLKMLPLADAWIGWLAVFGELDQLHLFNLGYDCVESAILSMGRKVEK